MNVGIPRELKAEEYRVALTPSGAAELVRRGHRVVVESGAAEASGSSDQEFESAGAEVVASAEEVWAADLIVKVKEPQPEEFKYLRSRQILFTYLHLSAFPVLTQVLLQARTTSIAYETVESEDHSLPLLMPMSQIAGRMAPLAGARWMQQPGPGRGRLLSGLPGAPPARVVIFGAGTVSRNACDVAVNLGAQVTVLAPIVSELQSMEERWPGRLTTLPSTLTNINHAIAGVDLLISGVNVRGGGAAPKLVSRAALQNVGVGAVLVDVAIDQGGIFETSRPTSHIDPVYVEEGVVHYCVPNMPGVVPGSSTPALCAATLPYVLKLADLGISKALAADEGFAKGLMTLDGDLTNQLVAESMGR